MQALGLPDLWTNPSAQMNLYLSFNLLKLLESLAYVIINLKIFAAHLKEFQNCKHSHFLIQIHQAYL